MASSKATNKTEILLNTFKDTENINQYTDRQAMLKTNIV